MTAPTNMQPDEWGPWIEHDGKGTPSEIKIGDYVEVESEDNETGELVRAAAVVEWLHLEPHSWTWGASTHDTLRYRIRKPRALLDLIRMVEELPELVSHMQHGDDSNPLNSARGQRAACAPTSFPPAARLSLRAANCPAGYGWRGVFGRV